MFFLLRKGHQDLFQTELVLTTIVTFSSTELNDKQIIIVVTIKDERPCGVGNSVSVLEVFRSGGVKQRFRRPTAAVVYALVEG